jgi:hypothetical protein
VSTEPTAVQSLFGTFIAGSQGQMRELWAFVSRNEDQIEFTVQAYADDVILISRKAEGIEKMLGVLERFVDRSKIEVTVKEYATASYLIDTNQRRVSLANRSMFKGQPIPNLTLAQSLKYLGTPVTARKTVKLEAVEPKLTEMIIRLRKIADSRLLIV